jgi:hypothetical protein
VVQSVPQPPLSLPPSHSSSAFVLVVTSRALQTCLRAEGCSAAHGFQSSGPRVGQGRRAACLRSYVCMRVHACVFTCFYVYLCVRMYACVCITCVPVPRSFRMRGRVTMCVVCSATAAGDGQHSRLRAASSQRLRLFCLAD